MTERNVLAAFLFVSRDKHPSVKYKCLIRPCQLQSPSISISNARHKRKNPLAQDRVDRAVTDVTRATWDVNWGFILDFAGTDTHIQESNAQHMVCCLRDRSLGSLDANFVMTWPCCDSSWTILDIIVRRSKLDEEKNPAWESCVSESISLINCHGLQQPAPLRVDWLTRKHPCQRLMQH